MPVFKIELHDEAVLDINDSYNWYEDRLPGLGRRFINALSQVFLRISENPESCPKKKRDYREAPLNGFPFVVIYEVLKKERVILVTYVFHTKRDPKLKYKR